MRNVLICLGLAVLFFMMAIQANAIVIYNTFGEDDSYDRYAGNWLSEGGPNNIDLDGGHGFIPGGNFALDRIELAMTLTDGPNELDAWIMDDNGGLPGNILESFHFTGEMNFSGESYPRLVRDSITHPILAQGSQYWLIASLTGPNASSTWHYNNIGISGPYTWRYILEDWNGEWQIASQAIQGAFRISGIPVNPIVLEPNTIFLFAVSLVGAGLFKIKRTDK